MQEWEQEKPLIIERGKGPYLIDMEGKRFLDGTSSIWVNLHGHRHSALDRAIKQLLFPTVEADPPYCYRCPLRMTYPSCQMACLDPIERIIKERHRELAGFIIEPLVQAAAGMLTSPSGYLRRIRELCTKYNVLLIADEVATGFGRTGKMFACQHEGVTP